MIATNADSKEKDNAHASGTGHALRDKSLKATGFSFLLGDIALISYGLGIAGGLGLTSGAIGATFGNPKAEKQLEQVERRLGAYLKRQGVAIPKNPTMAALTKESGVIDHIASFLYTYPSQIMALLYTLVGADFMRSGIKHDKKLLFASGCMLVAGALGGLFITEKKPESVDHSQGMLQKTWSWIQEKPLRVTGTFFTLNTALLAADALSERRQNPAQKKYLIKLLAAVSFAFGNVMWAISSKSAGGGAHMDAKTLNELATTSASIIANQPKEVQNALLEQTAGFLSSQPYVRLKASELSELMRAKLAEVASANPAGWQGRIAEAKAAQAQASL